MAKLFYIGIKALITNESGKVLVFEADITHDHAIPTDVYWDLPGGRIEENETINQTLRREVREEAGISQINSSKLFASVISNHEIPVTGGANAGLMLMIYEVSIPAGSVISLSDEHTAYEWVDRAEAKKRLAHKYPAEFTDLL